MVELEKELAALIMSGAIPVKNDSSLNYAISNSALASPSLISSTINFYLLYIYVYLFMYNLN